MSNRILLVEDDPVSRDLLASLLVVRGYAVDMAEDGFTALRFVQDNSYDLVFIDYHLPEMDGYALARLVRTLGERTGTTIRMVAITADRFGLAARRGADTVFDSMLTKPIDPDALYSFVEEAIGLPQAAAEGTDGAEDLDAFLAGPSASDGQNAAQVLWRVRGVAELPAAAVFPAPTPAERQSLGYCFRLVEPAEADCLILLRRDGLREIEALRAGATHFLQPLLTIDETNAPVGDVLFTVGDKDSWSAAAAALAAFRERRATLKPAAAKASDPAMRLAAYLHVADRSLVLRRDAVGRTGLPYTGGFAPEAILAAVKRLAAGGLVAARPGAAGEDGARELVVSLTAKGLAQLAEGEAVLQPVAG